MGQSYRAEAGTSYGDFARPSVLEKEDVVHEGKFMEFREAASLCAFFSKLDFREQTEDFQVQA